MKPSEPNVPRTSLSLLGGGVTGAFFHFGALAALDDHLSRKSTAHDVYVGTSAGSMVATTCAVGINPQMVVEAIIKDQRDVFHIDRRDIYRFSLVDWGGEFLKFLWTLFYIAYLKLENAPEAPSLFWGLKDSLPAGLFSLRYYEAWARKILEQRKLPLYFSELKNELYIPSYDLESCSRVVFGRQGYRHVPFFKCIAASSAIPIFFQPVEIEGKFYVDGGTGELAHLDLAADAGAKLIIGVNPMVPIRNDLDHVKVRSVFEEKGKIRDKGFTYIYDQNLRNEIRMRVRTAIKYLGYRNPELDILVIEPDDDDPTMFMFNPMDFESRRQIVEYGYELTRRKIRENAELWKRTLDRHEITVVGV